MASSPGSTDQPPSFDAADGADSPLRAYVRTKQAVGALLRELHKYAERSTPWISERAHDLVARLAEDRFQLVVVGQFKRGKSSLMNAIIGRPLLPTGTIPVTSAVTSLRHGSSTRVLIRRAGRVIDEEVPIDALADFVTERGNPDNRKQVLSVEVEVPVPFLRRGLRFIDTPGIGSAHERNTATTLAFMPEADAAILVTGADAPLSQSELEFLDAVRQHVSKVFFVLNKIDQVALPEREEVVSYTSQVLAQRLGIDTIRIFPMSAAQALDADRAERDAREGSGLPAFETALATFLDRERRTVFLVALLDRAIRLLNEMHFTLQLRARAIARHDPADDPTAALTQRYEEQDQQRLTAVARAQARVEAWQQTVLDPSLKRFAGDTRDALLADRVVSTKTRSTGGTGVEAAVKWMDAEIERRTIAWLHGMGGPVNRLVQELTHDMQPAVEHVIRSTIELAASVFGVQREPFPKWLPDDTTSAFRWTSLSFEAPASLPSLAEDPDSPAGVAQAVGSRLWSRGLSRRVPRLVDRATDVARETVLAFLRECVGAMNTATAKALDDERRRIEHAIRPEEDATNNASSIDDASHNLESLLSRAVVARDSLLKGRSLAFTAAEEAAPSPVHPVTANPRSVSTSSRKVVTGTCAICATMSNAVYDFLCHHQYAITVDRAAQQQFMATRGLCPTHTWHLEQLASPRGLADSYPLLLDDAAMRLQSMSGAPTAGIRNAVDALLGSAATCPACLTARRAEQAAAETLVQKLAQSTPTLGQQWVCLTHLHLLLTAVDDASAAGLVREQARRLSEVAESMREYVLKMDARRRELITDEEARAYRQGLVLLAGERYLVVTAPEE